MLTDASSKIVTVEELQSRLAAARSRGQRVVHCHGCFDLVHPGHIRHLRQARAMGDLLLVSVTGDSLVNKGDGRPLVPQELRAENLAALDCVDLVHVHPRATAQDLLEVVRPDVFVKGKEYETNSDPRFRAERETVERFGGRVVFSSGDVVFSSTALIAAIESSVHPFQARVRELARRPELSPEALTGLLSSFRGKHLVVVGECILDTYVLCDRPHVAGESPVLTLRPLERRHFDGGAAIIARHAAALGARATLVTALPESTEGEAMRRRLLAEGVTTLSVPSPTPIAEKQRFLVGAQKVVKLDLVTPLVLDAAQNDALVRLAARAGSGADAAIIADFGLGLFSGPSVATLTRTLRPLVKVLAGDVSGKRSHLRAMSDMDLVSPSESELREAMRQYEEGLPAVVWRLVKETGVRSAIVTMGPEGLVAFERLPDAEAPGKEWRTRLASEHVPALTTLAPDPLGCGDALLTAATLSLACGGSLLAAAYLGSHAAALEAQRVGNIPVSAQDLRRSVTRTAQAHLALNDHDGSLVTPALLRAS